MTRILNRRSFLLQAAAATTLAAAAREELMTIIDTHQHLWDLKKFRLPWLKKVESLNRSYLPKDYQAATAEVTGLSLKPAMLVAKAIYMEVDVDPEQQQDEADAIIALCKEGKTRTVAAVVSGRPASEGFARYVKQFKDSPYVKGIRQVLHVPETPAGYCLEKPFVAGIRLLGELGLSFDLCMRNTDLGDGAKLIDACPDTRFILDHCGNADVKSKDRSKWKKDMEQIAKRKNVVGKVSGFIASAKKGEWKAEDLAPIVDHTLDVFGPDRVMFGGDWPVCTLAATYGEWVNALRTIVKERPLGDQRKLFYGNAERFYRLA